MIGAFDGKRVLVVGAGKSGMAAARFCANRGAQVIVSDRRGASELMSASDALRPDIQWELGGHVESSFLNADLIVVSPGVPEIAELAAARKKGVEITGEIELASRFVKAPIVAITGTNGKSTTTALAGEIAQKTGRPTFVGGNLGTPLVQAVGTPAAGEGGLVVVELSSFQLETCETLHPRAAALLNLTPDHLDRYASMGAYGAAKMRIAKNMGMRDTLVVNGDDDWLAAKAAGLTVPVSFFSLRGDCDGCVKGGDLMVNGERYAWKESQLIGRHNQANALAAMLLMRASGLATEEQARAGLQSFRPLPHRMQFVAERRGVRFYDDSKATNVDSVVAGLDGFPTPFVLIAGGRDKGGSYAPLDAALQKNSCRAVVLIGEAADKMDAALQVTKLRAATMEEAVTAAAARAQKGDAVVLSPACSSYDMFDNYEHRGRVFKQAVEAL
jgi:UDP-N-acetylmuramoylalanine--D-glutamate ligase